MIKVKKINECVYFGEALEKNNAEITLKRYYKTSSQD